MGVERQETGRLGQSKAGWWRKKGFLLKRRLNIGISYIRGKAGPDENNVKKEVVVWASERIDRGCG